MRIITTAIIALLSACASHVERDAAPFTVWVCTAESDYGTRSLGTCSDGAPVGFDSTTACYASDASCVATCVDMGDPCEVDPAALWWAE